MKFSAAASCLLCVLLSGTMTARAADYWSYDYDGFSVVAQGSKAYALSVVRDLDTLDQAVSKLLGMEDRAQLPTRVYVMNVDDLRTIDPTWALQGGAFYQSGPLEQVLILQSENDSRIENKSVRIDRGLAWLNSQGLVRAPEWFKHGLSQLLAESAVDNDQLQFGKDDAAKTAAMAKVRWITMAKLLRLPANDPEFHKSPEDTAFYDAECWWLVREILFDDSVRVPMLGYLRRVIQGDPEEIAFVATFNSGYEVLDEFLKKKRHKPLDAQLNVPVPDIASDVTPTSLSAAQVKAHMARLKAISEPNSPLIEQWCSETLAVAPGDERAMLTLTDYYLHNRNFEKLRPLLQRLASDESLSAVGHREIAAAMTMLAKLRTDGVPGLESDAATALRADARRQLHLAIAKNATDPIAAYQLGWLLVSQGDVAAVRETLPTIETIFYTYPKSAALATLLVRMHAIGGSPEDEFKFAVVQSRLVDNEVERQAALRRIEKLRGQLKVK